jgi:hypothetical protein
MTILTACPVCGTPRPANRVSGEPWCCSISCYRTFHGLDQPEPESSSCHDAVTTACPVDGRPFIPVGRQAYCSPACRAIAYRRRRDAARPPVVVPKAQPRRPITVYECDTCGDRSLGDQRCGDCNTWMRRIGVGGCRPSCDEPIVVQELLGQNP